MNEFTTLGLSPKAILAFLFPSISSLVGAGVIWLTSGHFDGDAVKLAVGGNVTSGLGLLGAYVGKPGTVVQADTTVSELVPEWPAAP